MIIGNIFNIWKILFLSVRKAKYILKTSLEKMLSQKYFK